MALAPAFVCCSRWWETNTLIWLHSFTEGPHLISLLHPWQWASCLAQSRHLINTECWGLSMMPLLSISDSPAARMAVRGELGSPYQLSSQETPRSSPHQEDGSVTRSIVDLLRNQIQQRAWCLWLPNGSVFHSQASLIWAQRLLKKDVPSLSTHDSYNRKSLREVHLFWLNTTLSQNKTHFHMKSQVPNFCKYTSSNHLEYYKMNFCKIVQNWAPSCAPFNSKNCITLEIYSTHRRFQICRYF